MDMVAPLTPFAGVDRRAMVPSPVKSTQPSQVSTLDCPKTWLSTMGYCEAYDAPCIWKRQIFLSVYYMELWLNVPQRYRKKLIS